MTNPQLHAIRKRLGDLSSRVNSTDLASPDFPHTIVRAFIDLTTQVDATVRHLEQIPTPVETTLETATLPGIHLLIDRTQDLRDAIYLPHDPTDTHRQLDTLSHIVSDLLTALQGDPDTPEEEDAPRLTVPPQVDDETLERVAYAIFIEHDREHQTGRYEGHPREVSLAAARSALRQLPVRPNTHEEESDPGDVPVPSRACETEEEPTLTTTSGSHAATVRRLGESLRRSDRLEEQLEQIRGDYDSAMAALSRVQGVLTRYRPTSTRVAIAAVDQALEGSPVRTGGDLLRHVVESLPREDEVVVRRIDSDATPEVYRVAAAAAEAVQGKTFASDLFRAYADGLDDVLVPRADDDTLEGESS